MKPSTPLPFIRPASREDADAIWAILEPIIRAGETYALPREMSRPEALTYWSSDEREVFVAEDNGEIVGTYYLRANQKGGGAHVANCGYMTAPAASGKGVAARCAPTPSNEPGSVAFARFSSTSS